MEVPTIYKACFSGLCKGVYPQNMALYGTVPPFWNPEIPIEMRCPKNLLVLSTEWMGMGEWDDY